MKLPIYEHLYYFQKIDKTSKFFFQNMMIYASYPMYFDALKTNMNSKNRKSDIFRTFRPQNWSFGGDRRILGNMTTLEPKWPQNDHKMLLFLNFWVHICFQRIEIHRIRCKNCQILIIFFRHFIYFLKIMQMFINRELQSFKIYFKNRSINGKNLVKWIGKWLREC